MPLDVDYIALAEELGIRGHQNGDWFRACCPIHEGRDANFTINVRTGFWTCFSNCGSGSFITLVRDVLAVSMTGAYDWVRENAVTLPVDREVIPEPPDPQLWRDQYEKATVTLLPQWWFDRGFGWDDAAAWHIRWDAARQQLLIPVDWRGETVGIVYRNFAAGKPKYVNTKRLPKSEILFGAPRVFQSPIVIVEGTTDCIKFWQCGQPAVALLGLQMSEYQVRLLHLCPEVILALDNDEPGQIGTQEIIKRWGPSLNRLRTLTYPGGKKDAVECSADELAQMVAERQAV